MGQALRGLTPPPPPRGPLAYPLVSWAILVSYPLARSQPLPAQRHSTEGTCRRGLWGQQSSGHRHSTGEPRGDLRCPALPGTCHRCPHFPWNQGTDLSLGGLDLSPLTGPVLNFRLPPKTHRAPTCSVAARAGMALSPLLQRLPPAYTLHLRRREGPPLPATPSHKPPALRIAASPGSALGPDSGLAFWGYVPWLRPLGPAAPPPHTCPMPHLCSPFAVPLPPWTATPLGVGWAHRRCSPLNLARCRVHDRAESTME